MNENTTEIHLWDSFQFMDDKSKVIQAFLQILWATNVINKRPSSIEVNDTIVTLFFKEGYSAINHQLNDLMGCIGIQTFIDKINLLNEE